MKKSIFCVLLVLLVAISASAEGIQGTASEEGCGNHIITLGLSPWGWQHFYCDESGVDDKNSTFGLGGKIAYTYLFDCGFYVGAEAAYETYCIDHEENFHNVMFLADVGYNFAIGEKQAIYAGVGGGLELECFDGDCSSVGIFKADLGYGYSMSEHFVFGAGCDFIFGFPSKSSTDYVEFQIVPCITASYRF